MAEIILHPRHPDYCKECVFYDGKNGGCKSKDYEQNSYKVVCVWHYCKYKRKLGIREDSGRDRHQNSRKYGQEERRAFGSAGDHPQAHG